MKNCALLPATIILVIAAILATPSPADGIVLRSGNYKRFEAEYADGKDVGFTDYLREGPRYTSSGKIGMVCIGEGYSNQCYWMVSDQVGYAYRDITITGASSGDASSGGSLDFRYSSSHAYSITGSEDPILKVRYVFKAVLPPDIAPDTVIATFDVVAYREPSKIPVKIRSYELTKAEYSRLNCVEMIYGLREMTFSFSLSELLAAGICITEGDGFIIRDLNPHLFWQGHGILSLDYVEFMDASM